MPTCLNFCSMFLHVCSDHYEQVASGYNKCYAGTHTATMKVVMEQMMLTRDDMVVDIGGGTGYIAHQMWKQATLKHPVVCVEPSAAMLQATKHQFGVVPVQATAEEFFSNPRRYHFNKVLMCACIHHFKDPGTAFSGLSKYLPKSGLCVIITRPPATSLPFFTAAHMAFANSCANVKSLINILHSQELMTNVTTEIMQFEVKKCEWYKMLQDRYMSHLEQFTDDEIESGISELEDERFCGIQEHDLIQIYDPVTIIKVWKK